MRKAAAEENDWHGGTWEDIDAPWEQLMKAIVGLGKWIWGLGRGFLGLQVAVGETEVEEVKYSWTDQCFPRLELPPGDGTPAKGPTAEE